VNRFSGLLFFSRHCRWLSTKELPCKSHGETVETVLMILSVFDTGLKAGVNESKTLRLLRATRARLLGQSLERLS
jgi:hypothetical protein